MKSACHRSPEAHGFAYVRTNLAFTITGRAGLVMAQAVSHRLSLLRIGSDSGQLRVMLILDHVPLEQVLFFSLSTSVLIFR